MLKMEHSAGIKGRNQHLKSESDIPAMKKKTYVGHIKGRVLCFII